MTQTDPFVTAAQTGPVVRCLGNDRLIVAVPLRVEQQAVPTQYLNGRPPGTVSDVLVADVIAIDGGPIMFGGDPDHGVPDTQGPIMPGTPMREFRFYQTTLISQLRGHIGGGVVIGRLSMGRTKSNLPNWKLTDPRPGDKEMALGPYQAYATGAFQTAASAPRTAPQSAPPAQPAAAPVQAQTAAQPVSQPYGVPPVPGVGIPPMGIAPAQAAAATVQAAPPAPPADWTLQYAPPAGFAPDQWASFSGQQREQLLALNGVSRPAGV